MGTDIRAQPVVAGAFNWPSTDHRLLVSKCPICHTVAFPKAYSCPNPDCDGREVVETALSRTGTLASYTVVHYPPPPPYVPADPFEPFAIGEVSFPEGIQIVGPVTECEPANLEIGQAMETVIDTYYTAEDGISVVGWKFQPAGESAT